MADRNSRAVALREFQQTVQDRRSDFANALPAHIPAARFERVVMTAIQNNLQLLDAPRRELFNACVKAAQDGLLPDGREGALVCRPSKKGLTVTWQPMIAGIRKKARNSGEIATWDVHAVYSNDKFEFELGDEPYIKHRPALDDPGDLIAVYSVATLKSGEKSRDVMSIAAVHRIRDRSDAWKAYQAKKIRSTPWATDEAEMAKKTVARRHAKTLPMSTDLDDLIRRDDALYDLEGASDAAKVETLRERRGITHKLDALAGPDDGDGETIDNETGEVVEGDEAEEQGGGEGEQAAAARGKTRAEAAERGKGQTAKAATPAEDAGDEAALQEKAAAILGELDHRPSGIDPDDPEQVIAYHEGLAAFSEGVARRAVPGTYRVEGAGHLATAWQRGHDFAAAEVADESEEG